MVYHAARRGAPAQPTPFTISRTFDAPRVGFTERDARVRFGAIDVYATSFRPLKHTLRGRHERTTMKLVVDRESPAPNPCHATGALTGAFQRAPAGRG